MNLGEQILIGYCIVAIIYCIPSFVAFFRGHPNRWLIAVINLAFGGTVIGWFGALIWAMSAVHKSETGSNGGESGLNLFVNDPVQVQLLPSATAVTASSAGTAEPEISESLLRLKKLREQELVSEGEYASLRQDLLRRL